MDLVRNYPTRMHKITETEPGETFGFREGPWQEVKYYNLDAQGNVFRAVEDHKRVPSPREVVAIVNHRPPSCIIHKPRVTEAQIELLKAGHSLGMQWITRDSDGTIGMYKNAPKFKENKCDAYWEEFPSGSSHIELDKKSPLAPIVACYDRLIDITEILKDCGAL